MQTLDITNLKVSKMKVNSASLITDHPARKLLTSKGNFDLAIKKRRESFRKPQNPNIKLL